MIEINFDKLYRYPRIAEPCTICIPVEKGKIYSKDNVCVMQDGKPVPTQAKVTSRYDDTSIRYLFVTICAQYRVPPRSQHRAKCLSSDLHVPYI